MVRMPTMSMRGCAIEPSPRSRTVHATPRQPRSPASANPTGPAPTTSTGMFATNAPILSDDFGLVRSKVAQWFKVWLVTIPSVHLLITRDHPRTARGGGPSYGPGELGAAAAFPLVVSGYLRARDAGQDRERRRDDPQGHDDAADGQQVVRQARRDHRAVLRLRRVHRGGAEARPDRHNRHRQQRDRALQRDDAA